MDDIDTVVKTTTFINELPITAVNSDNINIFYHALLENDMAMVKDLVSNQNVDVNMIFGDALYVQPWHRGSGAIHIVTRRAIVESLRFIVELGANVKLENKHGDNALHIACKYGLVNCVEYVLQCDITLKDKQNSIGLTPLIKAVFKSEHVFRGQFKQTIKLLLCSGSNPNICPVSGISPLHLAARNADETLIRMLLNHGADVNAICSQGTSALLKTLLLRQQNSTCVKILLNAGADVNISTVAGRTALHLAVAKSENECVLNILIAGANPNSKDKYGKTPLWLAVQENNINIVRLLSKYGGDLNYQLPVRKFSLLSLAISEGLSEMVDLLISLGAFIFTESAMGATPLFLAVEIQKIQIVKSVLRENCDLDVISNARYSLKPQTPLQVAIELADLNIVKLLIEAGCHIKPGWIKALTPSLHTNNSVHGQEIIHYLQEDLSQVPSLKWLCRKSVRKHLNQNIKYKIDSLLSDMCIPGRLADYILLKDLI